ncbi:MAG TPA: tetratricopeptide repeat protein [Chthonomonadaceae bacterium]|nr:tetratricopeptide repeat protein [Chthonomonadaceae bacterium]
MRPTPPNRRPDLQLQLLGPFTALVKDNPLPRLRSRKGHHLLAFLALNFGKEVSRERLIPLLWPDSEPAQAHYNLRQCLTNLRQALGDDARLLLSPTPQTLCLDREGVAVDVAAFDAAAGANSLSGWEQVVALYQGPLLDGWTEEWVLPERTAREQTYLQALEKLASHASESKDPASAVRYLRMTVAADPFREAAHCRLMQALADCGDAAAVTQVYRDLRLLLHRELNASPAPETDALYKSLKQPTRRAVLRSVAPDPSLPPRRLPVPLTELIGREAEVEAVVGWLGKGRLLTLTGTGGVGKTRLAIAVAERLASEYPDGVWFVELAVLATGELVPQTVAQTLGIPEEANRPMQETLSERLASSTILLVLDNCEHLLESVASLADRLLTSCPGMRVLATSRQGLGLSGERLYRVPSLALPEAEWWDAEESSTGEKNVDSLLEYGGVRLFVERAVEGQPAFRLTRQNASAVLSICDHLDGIPLALEMAAARARALAIEEIRSHLEDRFRFLVSGSRAALPRHRTLRALMDWSHDLLTPHEQALFRRLSVFTGGWTLEAVEAVCADSGQREEIRQTGSAHQGAAPWSRRTGSPKVSLFPLEAWEILDLLTSLSEKSLVVYEVQDRQGRYRLLETVYEYARERLVSAEEEATYGGRHQDYFMKLAVEIRLKLIGPEQTHWLHVLETEHDNLRQALTFCLGESGDIETGMWMASALMMFWQIRGHVSEGRKRLSALLSHPLAQIRTRAHVNALHGAGTLARMQGDYRSARSLYEEGLAIARELGDKRGLAESLLNLGNVAFNLGDYISARALYEEGLPLRRELGDKQDIASSLNNLGLVADNQGDYASARTLYEESLAIKREFGDKQGIASSLNNLGSVASTQGDFISARSLFEESLTIQQELGERSGIALSLHNLGFVAYAEGDYAPARSLYREALAIRRELGERLAITTSLEIFAKLEVKEERTERAARLWGAAEQLREEMGSPLPPKNQDEYARHLTAARRTLGEEAFSAAWAEGRAMTLEQAIAYALA